ncbi:MAG: HipA domain-containing protein, partial [Acidimicrobiales bacterium]
MPDGLAVWLYGVRAGTLAGGRRGLSFSFSEDAYRRWGLRSPVLSLSMPVSTRPYGDGAATPFFEGLLPEGQLRRTIAYDFRISETDTLGLLAEIGRDCAGALVVQPEADGAPPAPAQPAAPIGSDEVAARIARLPTFPLGVDQRVRVSLPGMQNKLLLTRSGTGWALPTGAPSTHILKPAVSQLPGSVENEHFCMRLAGRVGLRAATTEVERFAGNPVLVVERFDRVVQRSGGVRRVHQEDAAQALAVQPAMKYEEPGGPSLRRVAMLLDEWRVPAGQLLELLRQVTFCVAVGDADHHAKNISILHHEDGRIGLTPLYDVMCTRHYPSVTTTPGMFVNGKRHIDQIRADDLVAEGTAWGLPEGDAGAAVWDVLHAL